MKTNIFDFSGMSKACMINFLYIAWGIPKGTSRSMNKKRLIEKYNECVQDEERHAAIARQASKPG